MRAKEDYLRVSDPSLIGDIYWIYEYYIIVWEYIVQIKKYSLRVKDYKLEVDSQTSRKDIY